MARRAYPPSFPRGGGGRRPGRSRTGRARPGHVRDLDDPFPDPARPHSDSTGRGPGSRRAGPVVRHTPGPHPAGVSGLEGPGTPAVLRPGARGPGGRRPPLPGEAAGPLAAGEDERPGRPRPAAVPAVESHRRRPARVGRPARRRQVHRVWSMGSIPGRGALAERPPHAEPGRPVPAARIAGGPPGRPGPAAPAVPATAATARRPPGRSLDPPGKLHGAGRHSPSHSSSGAT